nr:MAG TPA: hypothetical protein [Caudoviricetes sp.]
MTAIRICGTIQDPKGHSGHLRAPTGTPHGGTHVRELLK